MSRPTSASRDCSSPAGCRDGQAGSVPLGRQGQRPLDEVYTGLAAQRHDGVPLDSRVTYIVVARPPLDMAVSLYHQGDNLERFPNARTCRPTRAGVAALLDRPGGRTSSGTDSLPGVLWHLSDAWSRCAEPNVVLVHYDDLIDDLEAAMRHLAVRLAITVPDTAWPELVEAATFGSMRPHADRLAPDTAGAPRPCGALPARSVRLGQRSAHRRRAGPPPLTRG